MWFELKWCDNVIKFLDSWNSTVIVDNETDRARTTRSVIRQFYAFVINGVNFSSYMSINFHMLVDSEMFDFRTEWFLFQTDGCSI